MRDREMIDETLDRSLWGRSGLRIDVDGGKVEFRFHEGQYAPTLRSKLLCSLGLLVGETRL